MIKPMHDNSPAGNGTIGVGVNLTLLFLVCATGLTLNEKDPIMKMVRFSKFHPMCGCRVGKTPGRPAPGFRLFPVTTFNICVTVAAALCGTELLAHADYASNVLSLNPVAYYRLNDTTSPAADFSTNLGSLGAAANAYYNGVFGTDYTHPVAGALANGSDTAVQTLTGRGCIVVPHNDLLTNTLATNAG